MELIISLILTLAPQYNVPPYLALSLAMCESELNPMAVNVNYHKDGTTSRDIGLFQLNDRRYSGDQYFDIETNIHGGLNHIRELMQDERIQTWYSLIICYCSGTKWLETGKPNERAVNHARKVMYKWEELSPRTHHAVIRRKI